MITLFIEVGLATAFLAWLIIDTRDIITKRIEEATPPSPYDVEQEITICAECDGTGRKP